MTENDLEPFTYYLDAVGATRFWTSGQFKHHVDQYEKIYTEKIDDILFSCEIAGNKFKWTSLWFFNEEGAVETENFPEERKMRSVSLKNNVDHWGIVEQEDYEFFDCDTVNECLHKIGADMTARLLIEVILSTGQKIQFKSLGRNCDFLFYIFKKYIKANKIQR